LIVADPTEIVTLAGGDRWKVGDVELGIAAGGSTALISLLAQPRKLVACELNEVPVQALTEFIDARRATDVVRPLLRVDQSDCVRLAEIVDAEFCRTRDCARAASSSSRTERSITSARSGSLPS
jgi:hypothetical protein